MGMSVDRDSIEAYQDNPSGYRHRWACQLPISPLRGDPSDVFVPPPTAKERNRLYWLMSQKYRPLEKVLTQVGYELFFAEVKAFENASACDRSRYRPHLIGDDTKVAKTHACCMEYLTETLLSGRRTETASLQSGGALCYLRRHRLGNPGGDKALGTQGSPQL